MSAKIKLNLILNSFDLDKSWLKLKSTVFLQTMLQQVGSILYMRYHFSERQYHQVSKEKRTERELVQIHPFPLKLVRFAGIFSDGSAHSACPGNDGTPTRHDLGRSGMPSDRMESIDKRAMSPEIRTLFGGQPLQFQGYDKLPLFGVI